MKSILFLVAVTLLFGEGSVGAVTPATFSARRDYKALGQVTTADLNGDGIPDLVSQFGNIVYALLGNGNGTFRVGPQTVIPWEVTALGPLVDVNGDGIPDLVELVATGAETAPGGMQIYLGKGDGSFSQATFYQTGQSLPSYAVVGDFNGDGVLDVLVTSVCCGQTGLYLFEGTGAGAFTPAVFMSVGTFGGPILAADLNGDGRLDLVLQTYGGFGVMFGNGDGTFQPMVTYAAKGSYVVLGDMNRDGRIDILTGGGSPGTVYIFLNNGRGVFALSGQATLSGFSFTVGDINGDGIPDLADSGGCIALGLGKLKFAPYSCYPVPSVEQPYNVLLTDLRKNGNLDMVVGQLQVTSVLLNEGGGNLQDGLWIPVAGGGNCGATADYNADGKPDLAVPYSGGIAILFGTGNPSTPYLPGSTIPVSGGVGCPVSGDINGDGIPDLLFGSNTAGAILSYLGNGDGTFRAVGTVAVSPGHFILGDFNHDKRLDLVSQNNQIAFGKGDGTFDAPINLTSNPPAGGFAWVAAGDLNGDGWLDLVLPAYSANELYVLLNNQNGNFAVSTVSAYFEREGSGPEYVALADLNNDGKLDVIVQMYYGFSVAVYLGNGEGGLRPIGFYPYVASYPQPPQLGDVNGDHIPDLLMPASGSLGIALGKGDGTFLTQQYVGLGNDAGQIIVTNIQGQSPKIGHPDIVAPDGDGGVMVLLNVLPH